MNRGFSTSAYRAVFHFDERDLRFTSPKSADRRWLVFKAVRSKAMLDAEMPEERIEQALAFFEALGNGAKVGFESALANCDCHVCREILGRIKYADLR